MLQIVFLEHSTWALFPFFSPILIPLASGTVPDTKYSINVCRVNERHPRVLGLTRPCANYSLLFSSVSEPLFNEYLPWARTWEFNDEQELPHPASGLNTPVRNRVRVKHRAFDCWEEPASSISLQLRKLQPMNRRDEPLLYLFV